MLSLALSNWNYLNAKLLKSKDFKLINYRTKMYRTNLKLVEHQQTEWPTNMTAYRAAIAAKTTKLVPWYTFMERVTNFNNFSTFLETHLTDWQTDWPTGMTTYRAAITVN